MLKISLRCLVLLIAVLCLPLTGSAQEVFQDDSGQAIKIDKCYKRIISLYGAHTENLFSLGLDKKIIGVSKTETHPPQALEKPAFSYRDDLERFLAAKPDLVLIRPMIFSGYRNLVERLKAAGIQVVSLQPRTVDGMFGYWRKLGVLTGKRNQADAMISGFKVRLAKLRARVEPIKDRPGVYFESIHRKMKTFAPSAMAVFALEAAGGVNVARDAKPVGNTVIAAYGKERILSKARLIDVYLAQVGAMNKVTVSQIKNESGFTVIKAVKEDRVYLIDEQIVSRPTMRLLSGVEKIQALLYPHLITVGRTKKP
jgi:iron complex transport system substrate-binding protein